MASICTTMCSIILQRRIIASSPGPLALRLKHPNTGSILWLQGLLRICSAAHALSLLKESHQHVHLLYFEESNTKRSHDAFRNRGD